MGNKFTSVLLVISWVLLYLGGAVENTILGTSGFFLLTGMAVMTVLGLFESR